MSEKRFAIIESRIDALDEYVEELEQELKEVKETNKDLRKKLMKNVDTTVEAQLTTAERVLAFGWDKAHLNKTNNNMRAIRILQNWTSLKSDGFNAEFVEIKYIKRYLDTTDDASIDYKTASRVAKKIEDLTDGKFEVSKQRNGNKILKRNPGFPFVESEMELVNLER